MLLIIFVFDPLAIAMVVAANMAFAQIRGFEPKKEQKEYNVDGVEKAKQIKEYKSLISVKILNVIMLP